VTRRLGQLAAAPDSEFNVTMDGAVTWRGQAAGKLDGGRPSSPRVRLFGELGPEPARERAGRRLEAYLAAESSRRLAPLSKLEAAMADGALKGLPRGVAHQLIEAGGVIDRRAVESELKALSQAERRSLRALGVRIGAFSVWMPALLKPHARALACAFAETEAPGWRAPSDRLTHLSGRAPAPRALAARGLRAVGHLVVPVEALERLDEALRAGRKGPGSILSDEARQGLGWSEDEARQVLTGLGYMAAGKPKPGEPVLWRPRRERPADAPPKRPAPSPFAALEALKPAPAADQRRPNRHRPRRRPKTARS
jgi:ATP-dependent RNA helicase SUPV3L1/SUV3